jgi:hypothetical protein
MTEAFEDKTYLQAALTQLIIIALHGFEHTRNDFAKDGSDLRRRGTRNGSDELHGSALLLEVGI